MTTGEKGKGGLGRKAFRSGVTSNGAPRGTLALPAREGSWPQVQLEKKGRRKGTALLAIGSKAEPGEGRKKKRE